ncbi:MAG: MFS transporter [Pseudomonadota bacterium]
MALKDRLAPFRIAQFRNLWFSDALSLSGFEMETLILAWYVLQESNSPFLVGVIGALRFGGTLVSPFLGVYVDRLSKQSVILWFRVAFLLVSLGVMTAAFTGTLELWQAFVAAAVQGLLRPPEMVVRQALIADSVPANLLMNAMGFSRINLDGAKIVGALTGAGTMAAFGIGNAYLIVSVVYAASLVFTLRMNVIPPAAPADGDSAWMQLRAGLAHIRAIPPLNGLMWLAFVANLVAYPVSYGLLPVIARDEFNLDELGLANMVVAVSVGALIGSVVLGFVRTRRPSMMMVLGVFLWQFTLLAFALSPGYTLAMVMLFFSGLASSIGMTSMSVMLMLYANPAYRGRVMGVRMLAVYGLPLGLLVAGYLFEQMGVRGTLTLMGAGGLVVFIWQLLRWRRIAERYEREQGMPPE